MNRLSVLENVLIGALGSTPFWRTCFSWFTREQKQRALQALTRVGMVHFAHQRVSTLSGGQQQRVAIARALMQRAKVILADEPIASLDPESARIVMDTLRDINQNDGITVVVTLHQVDYALRYCERIVALRRGTSSTTAAANSLITNVLTISTAALTASKRTRKLPDIPSLGKRMNAKIIASLAFTSMFSLSTLLSPAHAKEQEKALNFGIISTESQQNLKPQWTPFLQDMEKKLGVKVNAFFARTTRALSGMRFNKVDIARYGNLSAMEAVDRANGQVFARQSRRMDRQVTGAC